MNGARKFLPWFAIAIVAAVLLYGLGDLFSLRFARGDIYPQYSTLRTDPLGTMVLYEGFAGAGIKSVRHFRDLERNLAPEGTLYACGVSWSDFADDDVDWWKLLLERIEGGGRVVLTFAPTAPPDETMERLLKTLRDKQPLDKREKKDDEKKDGDEKPDAKPKPALILDRLELKVSWLAAPKGVDLVAELVATETDLPGELPWHTALSFAPADPAWRTLYKVGVHPTVIERALGKGTIVLVGDAYLLSNEAMLRARRPTLLAWLQSGSRRAVFDESHLGVVEDRGVASLARRYGLSHTAIVLLLVALLFIWKNASSLVPPTEAAQASGVVEGEFVGRESAAGFVSLLRRTLAPRDFFAACVSEYRRSTAWRRANDTARRALEALAAPGAAKDPLEATRRAHELLARKF